MSQPTQIKNQKIQDHFYEHSGFRWCKYAGSWALLTQDTSVVPAENQPVLVTTKAGKTSIQKLGPLLERSSKHKIFANWGKHKIEVETLHGSDGQLRQYDADYQEMEDAYQEYLQQQQQVQRKVKVW